MDRRLKVAVADDEPEVRQHFAKMLRLIGHQVVVVAADGNELVEGCRALIPDLIITDIRMNHMSGLEAIRELREEGFPVVAILVSAHSAPWKEINQQLDGDVLDFLTKPVKIADLKLAVDKAVFEILGAP